MGGKTTQSTSQVQIPPDVLARYNSVNARAEDTASAPFQSYSADPNAFVAPLTETQVAGVNNTNAASGMAQPYYNAATGLTVSGAQSADPSQINAGAINQYLSPFLGDVYAATLAGENQQNQIQASGLKGEAIKAGAFGGDRAGVAQANLAYNQNLANTQRNAELLNTGYNTALGTAQQQQGVDLGARQQNLARLTKAGEQIAGLGTTSQQAALTGAQAQLAAGTAEQQTQQAGLSALYNQFLQEQGYPFQVSQFLANIAEGTGALSGSTTNTTTPGAAFSDIRLKDDVQEIGKTFDGQKIIRFRYKGSPKTQIGLVAQDVEKHHPHAVGLASGYKTVDYDEATRPAANKGHYASGGLVPAADGGTVTLSRSGEGYASGGVTGYDPAVYSDILSRQQGMYGKGGLSGAQIFGGPHGIAISSGPKRDLVTSKYLPQAQPSTASQVMDGADQARKFAGTAKSGYQGYKDLKDWWNKPNEDDITAKKGFNDDNSGNLIGSESDSAADIDASLADEGGGGMMGGVMGGGPTSGFGGWKRGGLVPHGYAGGGDVDPYALKDGDTSYVPQDEGGGNGGADHGGLKSAPPPKVQPKDPAGGAMKGAMTGATSGAMFGPWGAVIGGVGGALYGGLSNSNRGGRINRYSGGLVRHGYDDGGDVDPDASPETQAPRPWRLFDPIGPSYSERSAAAAEADRQRRDAQEAIDSTTVNPSPTDWQQQFADDAKRSRADARARREDGLTGPPARDSPAPTKEPPVAAPAPARDSPAPTKEPPVAAPPVAKNAPAPRALFVPPFEKSSGLGGAERPVSRPLAAGASPHSDKPGFLSQLGDFVTSEKGIIPILTGIGAMASSPSRYGWAAALQGLGAGAQAYEGVQNQMQKREQSEAQTQGFRLANVKGSITPPIGQKTLVRDPATGNPVYMSNNEFYERTRAGERIQVLGDGPGATGGGIPTGGDQTTPGAQSYAPKSQAPTVTPGVTYDDKSRQSALREIPMGPGQQALSDKTYGEVMQAADIGRQGRPMMLETVSQIASANQNAALGTPGASFSGRAAATNVLNTLARAMGLNAPFGEQDEQKAIVDKVRTLEAALLANGGDQRAISAIQVLMGTYPSLDMPPAAAAELAAQLMTARQRTIDRAIHMRQYKDDADTSNGSVMNEATDFERAQADRYQRETKIIGNLILDPSGNGAKALESMRRGEASPRQIDNWFTKHYGLSGMSRYFRAD